MKKECPVIYVRDLCKSFRNISAVNNISLEVNEGELFCVAGPDGAGKTTTVRLLLGLLAPDEGEIFLGGLNVGGSHDEVKMNIGYVPQKFSIYEDLTVRENVVFFATLYNLAKKDRREKEEQAVIQRDITLITNQWYYITAKSENGAGLVSNVFSSDGFIYVNLGMNEENSQ